MGHYHPKHKLAMCDHGYYRTRAKLRFVGISKNGLPLVICNKCSLLFETENGMKRGVSKIRGDNFHNRVLYERRLEQ